MSLRAENALARTEQDDTDRIFENARRKLRVTTAMNKSGSTVEIVDARRDMFGNEWLTVQIRTRDL